MEENEDEPKKKKELDPLSKVFGINPLNGQLLPNGKIKINDSSDDYEYSRQNIMDLIDHGNQYLQQFGMVAMQSQEPRAVEVLTNLLKALVEANEKLLDLKAKNQVIKEKDTINNVEGDVINNNLFVGSTNDMQTIFESLAKKKE